MALQGISPLPEKHLTQTKPGTRPGRSTGEHRGIAVGLTNLPSRVIGLGPRTMIAERVQGPDQLPK
jgi:hypothetical protein